MDFDKLKTHVDIYILYSVMQSIYSLHFIPNSNMVQNVEAYTSGVFFAEGEQTFNFQITPLSCLFKII